MNNNRSWKNKAFSMIELLVVIAIIGILASILFVSLWKAHDSAYYTRSKAELSQIAKAIELYLMDNEYDYPSDVDRGLPNGIEEYISSNPDWPNAPWPGSFYDWDYWDSDGSNPDAGTLSYSPDGEVYQISVRFCPLDDPANCKFPDEPWASGFDYYSSAYWCIAGPCRAHGSKPADHPSCCIGGSCPAGVPVCK